MNYDTSETFYLDLTAKRNDYWNRTFGFLDDNGNTLSFSDYTFAKLSLKNNENSTTPVLVFSSTGETYQIDISGLATGSITFSCDSFNVDANTYQYELELYNNARTRRVTPLAGKITITNDLTA